MDSNIYSTELEEMREQIKILKEKLDKEKIINDRVIKRAMNKNINKLHRQGTVMVIFGTITTICCPIIIHNIGMPLWFTAFTAFILIFSTIATAVIHRGINSDMLYNEDMLQIAQRVHKLKLSYKNWLFIGIPMVIVFIGLFIYMILQSEIIPQEAHLPMFTGILVGGLIGGALGVMQHVRLHRTCNELLNEIKELRG